jgi:hypothetical protein
MCKAPGTFHAVTFDAVDQAEVSPARAGNIPLRNVESDRLVDFVLISFEES